MSLERALALVDAAGPVGYPNPTVGAVLVADGAIVGEGVTEAYGRHGEVVALAAAGGLERLRVAGVEAELDDRFEARRQNEAWRTWKSLGRPFVVYKAAISLD